MRAHNCTDTHAHRCYVPCTHTHMHTIAVRLAHTRAHSCWCALHIHTHTMPSLPSPPRALGSPVAAVSRCVVGRTTPGSTPSVNMPKTSLRGRHTALCPSCWRWHRGGCLQVAVWAQVPGLLWANGFRSPLDGSPVKQELEYFLPCLDFQPNRLCVLLSCFRCNSWLEGKKWPGFCNLERGRRAARSLGWRVGWGIMSPHSPWNRSGTGCTSLPELPPHPVSTAPHAATRPDESPAPAAPLRLSAILGAQVRTRAGQVASASRNDGSAGLWSVRPLRGPPPSPRPQTRRGARPGLPFWSGVSSSSRITGWRSFPGQPGGLGTLPFSPSVCTSVILKYYIHEV